jgi:hypothetical protein
MSIGSSESRIGCPRPSALTPQLRAPDTDSGTRATGGRRARATRRSATQRARHRQR